jgi:acetyl-CoA carboxylase biotin carboxyl carrier protein
MADTSSPSWDELLQLVTELDGSDFENVAIEYGDVSVRMSRGALLPDAGSPNGATRPAATTDAAVSQVPAPAASAPEPAPVLAPQPNGAAAPAATVPDVETTQPQGTAVPSPMIGVFYRSPSPGAPPFVSEGDRVEVDSTVGIIEVMKLMNPVQAGIAGVVSSFAVADAQAVEFGEDLLYVIPETS